MKKTPKISKTDDSDLEENLIDELEDENSGVQIDSSRKQTRKPSKASNVAKMLQFMEKNERQAQQKTRTDEKREERIAKQKRHEERMEAQTRLLEILAASLPKKEEKRKSKKKKRNDSSSSEE